MSVVRELTNGTPPTLSLTIVDSGRDAILIWLELGTRTTLRACFGRGGVRTDACHTEGGGNSGAHIKLIPPATNGSAQG